MNNGLTEEKLISLLAAIKEEPISIRPSRIVVTEEGLARMKALCGDDPEFRKRVLAEFPQLEGLL